MKKNSILFNLLGLALCAFSAPAAAADCFPCCNDCCDWNFCDGKITLGADWLYWRISEDNLSLGSVANNVSTSEQLPQVINGRPLTQNFKYDSGFRVNLGYELPDHCWDVNFCYTYFPSHSSSSTFTSTDTDINSFSINAVDFPLLSAFQYSSLLQDPTFVTTKWNFTGNNIDVDLGRTITFGECLKVRPHIGFRATWFDQKLRYYAQSNLPTNPLQQVSIATFSEKFTGTGVEGGLWGEWQLGCGLSVVGHFGGSILYSKFRMHEKAVAANVTVTPGDLLVLTGCESFRATTPTMDYFVGLQYDTCLCDMLFSMHVGWEQHVLFNVNRMALNGNLAAQGLTLGLQLGF